MICSTKSYGMVHENGGPHPVSVSVVVPCYKVSVFLKRLIRSLNRQTLKDIEIIFVDDGCPENSGKAVVDVLKEIDFLGSTRVYRLNTNRGLAHARNFGLVQSKGDFVFFLDADNRLHPKALEKLYRFSIALNLDAAFSHITTFGESRMFGLADEFDLARLLLGVNYIDAMAMHRKEVILEAGGFRQMSAPGWEDYDLWIRYAKQKRAVGFLPQPLCRYRVSSSGMLQSTTEQNQSKIRLDMCLYHPELIKALKPYLVRQLEQQIKHVGIENALGILLNGNSVFP